MSEILSVRMSTSEFSWITLPNKEILYLISVDPFLKFEFCWKFPGRKLNAMWHVFNSYFLWLF